MITTMIVTIFCISAFCIKAQWQVAQIHINGKPYTKQLHDITFTNDTIGYIACSDGILRTNDGTKTWSLTTLPSFESWKNSVYFVTANIGFALGNGLYKTEDGGQVWFKIADSAQGIDDSKTWRSSISHGTVIFFNQDRGLMAGTGGESSYIAATFDGGRSWLYESPIFSTHHGWPSVSKVNDSGAIMRIHYLHPPGSLYKTINMGISWQHVAWDYRGGPKSNCLYFKDSLYGWHSFVLYDQMEIAITRDGGRTWQGDRTMFKAYSNCVSEMKAINDIYFVDRLHGYAVDECGNIHYSSDGGETWSKEGFSTAEPKLWRARRIASVSNDKTLYVVGAGGLIAKKQIPSGVVRTNRQEPFTLYPNPTTGTLHISGIDLSNLPSGVISITIRDMLGRTLMEASANDHSTTLDISHMPVGQYIVQVGTGVVLLVKQ